MQSQKIKNEGINSKTNNNSQFKDDNIFLEKEISIITKKIRKELNEYNKIYKNHKLDLLQTYNEYELENNKYKKINYKMDILEKEIEFINKEITKIKKKKLYSISSIIKFSKIYKQPFFEKYKSLLNIGLTGPQDNYNILEGIKENTEEFSFYLNFLEKYYISLQKDNFNEYIKKKNEIKKLINDENLSFPDDKLLFYLNYVFQIIDLTNELNQKTNELKNEELKRIELYSKIKNFELLIKEQKNFISDAKDYIDLLKNIIQKYSTYLKKYKNNLISKETLYKKIRKLQSINYFEIGNNTSDDNNKTNHSIKTALPEKKKYKNFIKKRNNKYLTPNIQESKSQNITKNTLVDYLSQIEEPVKKKNIFEKNEVTLNEIFFTMSKDISEDSDKENISQRSEHESPVSTINISSRKKNLINDQILLKTTIQNNKIKKQIPIPKFSINDLNYINNIHNKLQIKNNETNNIYCKKKLNFRGGEIKKANTTIRKNGIDNTPLNKNKILITNKTPILPTKENEPKDIKNSLYISKNIARNKKNCFCIHKNKLFNKDISKTIVIEKSQLNLLCDENEEPKQTFEKNLNKSIIKKSINNSYIDNIKTHCANQVNQIINNNYTYEINNYYGDINKNNCHDSIQTIKDEFKQKKYLYLRKNRIKFFRAPDIKNDIHNENCCVSCI